MTATERQIDVVAPLRAPRCERGAPRPPALAAPSPWEKVRLARNPRRPHVLDYIHCLCRDFVELRGDRAYADDQAIVGGLGRTELGPVVVIGQQKGRDTRENVRRNFGMPHPEGYRKALRLMRHAEKFGMPVLCFVDTPAAYPGEEAEARGQAQAIAHNLLAMARLRVPILATVIGEGGSGGALAIGLADCVSMLEHAIYSVAPPEASAAILWRDAGRAREAAAAMKITAQDLLELGAIDEIIPEPAGGAHTDPAAAVAVAAEVILRHLREVQRAELPELLWRRYNKYRNIGFFYE